MKSNYEHLVLTASCLKADSRLTALHHVQGRSALILQVVAHPDASCAKQHPTNNCPYQRVLIPISVPGQWELGTKFPSEDQTLCFSKAELLPYRSRQCQAAAVGGLYRLYLHRRFLYLPRNPPLLQSPWCRAALGEGLILCPRLPSRCCQGQPPVVGAGGAGTDHDD